MTLRRGFRKEAEQYATEYRAEMRLATDGPLSPFELAAHLEIPVVPFSKLDGFDRNNPNYHPNPKVFAFTLPEGTFRTVFHNDLCHPHRQHSDLMHEISHIALGHPPHSPLGEDGCRNFDRRLEEEAKELAFTLLVPKVAARKIVSERMGIQRAIGIYGVSRDLLEYRLRITDAYGWHRNVRRKYG